MSADAAAIADALRPQVQPIDLGHRRTIHIVGIGGAGMRAIARVLLQMGHRVSGSDRAGSKFLDDLSALGATVRIGHVGDLAGDVELVTRSTAVPDDNPEVIAARDRSVPVHSRAAMLAAITAVRPAILVAGTHGKTTTSSMLAVVLDHAGLAPSFVIGSDVTHFGTGARWTTSEHFVVEADESDGTFLALLSSHAVVTSLDPDHLEFYGSPERLGAAFEAFVESVPGVIAVCIDDPDTEPLIGRRGVVTYGSAESADLRISDVAVSDHDTTFDVAWHRAAMGRVSVGLPGHHNALNAAAALVLALSLDVPFDTAAAGLAEFSGVARRFERRGEQLGVRFVDDYAHLPAEVEAVIATARQGPWNRVIAAYQPHRFSRTQALGPSFATSFRGVDHLVLSDIYPSGEAPRAGVSGRIVYDAVVDACPELSVSWQPTLDDVTRHLSSILGPGDLCLTLGAGDLTTVPDRVLAELRAETPISVAWLGDQTVDQRSGQRSGPGVTKVRFNEPLGPLTTYRVGGAALALVEVATRHELDEIVTGARTHGTPLLVIGKGSNLLVADRGYRGVAVQLVGDFETIEFSGATVTLGAAVSLPAAARRTVAQSLTGFEWAVGVPGSVGGAIAMNAGGHGSDMAASVVSATVLDAETGERTVRTADELAFGYRRSSISRGDIVLDATLELARGDRTRCEQTLNEIVRWRRENQPGGQNAGSVFANPPGDRAGRLIDAAGGKGMRVGTAEVSTKHANFIQADPGGRADDVYALMQQVIELVRASSGISLEAETRLVGFEGNTASSAR